MSGLEFVANFPDLERLAEACEIDPQFKATFSTEEACRQWFFRARWPNGFECPCCRHRSNSRGLNARGVIECGKCRRQTSLTAGTLLHGTRKPMRTWFEAAYLVVQHGVNARTLQRELGLTYKVAWLWGHKLRAAMKPHVIPEGADPSESLRLEASRIRAVEGWVRPLRPNQKDPCGCTKLLRRDWSFPDEMEETRQARRAESRYARGIRDPEEVLPEDYPPMPKTGVSWDLLATFNGSLSERHLRRYLDEFEFRENRRERPVDEGFLTLARALAVTEPRTYRTVVARPAAVGHSMCFFPTSAPVPRGRQRTSSA